jgi:hypothetical protein
MLHHRNDVAAEGPATIKYLFLYTYGKSIAATASGTRPDIFRALFLELNAAAIDLIEDRRCAGLANPSLTIGDYPRLNTIYIPHASQPHTIEFLGLPMRVALMTQSCSRVVAHQLPSL